MIMNEIKEFGEKIKNEYFMHEPGTAFCNHGSYGAVPKSVFNHQEELRKKCESHLNRFIWDEAMPRYKYTIERVSKFVQCSPETLVLIENVTTGVATVLNHINVQSNGAILINSHTYPSVRNAVKLLTEKIGATLISIPIPIPIISENQVLDVFHNVLKQHKNTKIGLAIADHISSCSAIQFPVKKLVRMFDDFNIPVLVDGAHAPGQVELALEDLNADYYVGNFHKWGYAPRGCAILRIHPKYRETLYPLVISHFYNGDLHDRFHFQGTRDNSAFFSLPNALDFYNNIGGYEKIIPYNSQLVRWAQELICSELKTKKLDIPSSLEAPCMVCVELPKKLDENGEVVPGWKISLELQEKFRVVAPITEFNQKHWVRLSANVYNTKNDYHKLSDALIQIYRL